MQILIITTIGTAAGTIVGYDVINNFALGTGASNSETLDVFDAGVTGSVVANAANVDGANGTLLVTGTTAVRSHAIAAGIFTFDDADTTFVAAETIDSIAELAAVVQYLQLQDLGGDGTAAAFLVTLTGVTSTFVFIQGVDAGTDTSDSLVQLVGVSGTSMSATNANTAGLIDLA